MLDKRILIVEDEAVTALFIKKSLMNLGFEIISIVDKGKDAILKAKELKPDLILMDIVLKGEMDGIEAAHKIHEHSDIPIVYLTAYSNDKMFERAKLTGPYGFVVKPVDFYELKCTLETAFYRYDLEKELKEIKDNLELKVKERTKELVKLVEELKLKNFLLDAATDSIFLHDLEGNIIYANEAAYKSRGYTKDEILCMNIRNLNIQGALIIPSIEELNESGEFIFESADLCKDKSLMQIEVHSRIINLYDKKFVLSVVRNINKRKQMEKEREKLLEDLKRSNDELKQFAYVTSHDLQEPLRTIASFTQLLERRYKGKFDSDADEFMDYIVSASIRMKQLIQDLLQYSRVSAKPPKLKEVSCEDVLEGVIRSLNTTIDENKVNITYDTLPMVMADENLYRIFLNLILNAIKFKKPDETPLINISVKKDENDEFIFSVSDNGIGIEKQYFNRIFIIFQRLHTIEAYEGTGIGLAIVKRIIDNYGGRIWVESEPGVGSVFYFTLPKP